VVTQWDYLKYIQKKGIMLTSKAQHNAMEWTMLCLLNEISLVKAKVFKVVFPMEDH